MFSRTLALNKKSQSGINMVDLMMWLVIAALMLAAAIQGIAYYQQAAYVYQAKNDVTHGIQWAAARVSVESAMPTIEAMQKAIDEEQYRLTNDPDIALLAAQGQKYCLGVQAYNVKGNNIFYATSDDPANIIRAAEMPASCGTIGDAGGPEAPPRDTDNDGISNPEDDDIDGDGIRNIDDPDIDGDGKPNGPIDGSTPVAGADTDNDGDRISNADDQTPNGVHNGSTTFPAFGTAAIDPRVEISMAEFNPNRTSVDIALQLDLTGIPYNTGPYYGMSYRLTCQLPDGSQYYHHGGLWTSYNGNSNPNPLFNYSCPTTDSSIIVGYVVGPYAGHEALTEPISGIKGPINVATQGIISPFTGNAPFVPAGSGGYTQWRVSLRNAVMKDSNVTAGISIDLGGQPANNNPYLGVTARLTCLLPDNSTFYAYPAVYFSYNGNSYPAPTQTFTCSGGAKAIGYVVGADGAHEALLKSSGQRGPMNVLVSGQQELSGNEATIDAIAGSWMDQRVSVRKVSYTGGTANVGMSINNSGVSNLSSTYYGVSYRLTCESTTTGAKTYKSGSLWTSYKGNTSPIPSFNFSCPAGNNVVGYVVGPDRGHAALTSNSGSAGPRHVAIGGIQ